MKSIEHPALAHSVKRRQQVADEPQPSSRAGSSRHGVEVRALNTIAAKQPRPDMARRRPPYGAEAAPAATRLRRAKQACT
jgi:hypothetical protein